MLNKSLLSAAAIALGLFGGALPAVAGMYDHETYGGPHQTWCDIDPNCNGWNKRLQEGAYQSHAAAVASNPRHRASGKRSHETNAH